MTKESKDALAAVLPAGAALPLSASSGDLISMSAGASFRDGLGGSSSDLRSDYSEGGATPSIAGASPLVSIYSSGYLPGLDPGHGGAAGAGALSAAAAFGRGLSPAPLTAVALPSVRPGGGAAGQGPRLAGGGGGDGEIALVSAEDVTSGGHGDALPSSAFSSPMLGAADADGGSGAVRFTTRLPSHSLEDGAHPAAPALSNAVTVTARLVPHSAVGAAVPPPPLPHGHVPAGVTSAAAMDSDSDVGLVLDGHTPAGGSPAASSGSSTPGLPLPPAHSAGAANSRHAHAAHNHGHGHSHGHGHGHGHGHTPPGASPASLHHAHPSHHHHPLPHHAALAAKHGAAVGRPSSPLAQTVFPLAAALPAPQRASSYDSVGSNRAGHVSPPVSPHHATPPPAAPATGGAVPSATGPDRIAAPRTSSTASASGSTGGGGGGSGGGSLGSSTSSIGRASAALAAGLRAAVNSAGLSGVVAGGPTGPGAEPLLPLGRPGKRASFKDGASSVSTVSVGAAGGSAGSVTGSGAASTRTVSGVMEPPCFKPAGGEEEADGGGFACEIDDSRLFAAAPTGPAIAVAAAAAVVGE